MKIIARWLVALALLLTAPAYAQSTLLQGGAITPGHAPMYVNSGSSQAVVQDSGPAGGGPVGLGMGEGLYVARGAGTPPYASKGTGPLGANWCDYDAPITNATGYHYLCLSPNAGGGEMLSVGAGGPATPMPLIFNINGSSYQFPAILSGVVGPSTSVVGDFACWNNTVGTLLKDCGSQTPTFADNLTATGSNQGTAFLVSKAVNAFTTVSGGTGAILPITDPYGTPISAGFEVELLNAGANSLSVYPPSGQSIESNSANAAVSIFMNGDVRFIYRGLVSGTGAWYAR